MSGQGSAVVTETVDLGPCQCPGAPHERDTAEIIPPEALKFGILRRVRSARELEVAAAQAGRDSYGGLFLATLIALATARWSLVDGMGKPVPIGIEYGERSLSSIDDLPAAIADALLGAFNTAAYANAIRSAEGAADDPSRGERQKSIEALSALMGSVPAGRG